MAGTGGGPSRRSHTKSRKGCKTCKRRHIRCDETFPQCRNCTKHQVRCDYMETVGSDTESQASPEQPPLVFTPNTENSIDLWQQTGSFPYPELQVFPYPQTHEYSKDELRLMHHLSTISNGLMAKGTANLTLWTEKLPKFLSLASSYPYVMHALLSFSANHLAWARSSTEIRNIHIQHGTVALRGLHEAIGNFSHGNADAVLAASLLLLWQATDWRSWSSLRAGIQSVLVAMQQWNHDSIFAEYIAEEELAGSFRLHRRTASLDPTDRTVVLQNTIFALQRLQLALTGNELESYWIGQLLAYLQRLQGSTPAQTPDEQFSHLYLLRKWLFWVPISLLERQGGQGPAMLTLAHFYSTALALEPLFPDLGSSFCAKIALGPLEAIIGVTNAMQTERALDQTSSEIASLMQFPQQTVMSFRTRHSGTVIPPEPLFSSFSPDTFGTFTSIGNLSPAFAPSPLHFTPGHTQRSPSQSSFLEVPGAQSGFTYGTQSWGAIPSPGFPPSAYTTEDDMFSFGDVPTLGGFRSGFVQPATIWT